MAQPGCNVLSTKTSAARNLYDGSSRIHLEGFGMQLGGEGEQDHRAKVCAIESTWQDACRLQQEEMVIRIALYLYDLDRVVNKIAFFIQILVGQCCCFLQDFMLPSGTTSYMISVSRYCVILHTTRSSTTMHGDTYTR